MIQLLVNFCSSLIVYLDELVYYFKQIRLDSIRRQWLPPLQIIPLLALSLKSLDDENFHRPVLNDCDCKHLF